MEGNKSDNLTKRKKKKKIKPPFRRHLPKSQATVLASPPCFGERENRDLGKSNPQGLCYDAMLCRVHVTSYSTTTAIPSPKFSSPPRRRHVPAVGALFACVRDKSAQLLRILARACRSSLPVLLKASQSSLRLAGSPVRRGVDHLYRFTRSVQGTNVRLRVGGGEHQVSTGNERALACV